VKFVFENRSRFENSQFLCSFTGFLANSKMVPTTGLEPVRCYSLEPESSASANSATWASGSAAITAKRARLSSDSISQDTRLAQAGSWSARLIRTYIINPLLDLVSIPQSNEHTMNSINSLSAQQLRRAAAIKEQIDALENELGKILGGGGATQATNGKRTMSASARARIAAAQKARWAKVKSKSGAKPARSSKRRRMSPAARAKIAAAAKARWAKAKAAGRKSL
jgi:hypothetical protein